MWMLFLEEEECRTTKQDLYLAQIAAEVRRTVSKRRVSLKQLILPFVKKISNRKLTKKEATTASKMRWFSALGLKKDGSNT